MSFAEKVDNIISRNLRRCIRTGDPFTFRDLSASCVNDAQRQHLETSPAFRLISMANYMRPRIVRRMKSGLPENTFRTALPNVSPQIAQSLQKLPMCICLNEGSNAPWVSSLRATKEQWIMNSQMKEMKAQQTLAAANVSLEMVRFLEQEGYDSLAEIINGE